DGSDDKDSSQSDRRIPPREVGRDGKHLKNILDDQADDKRQQAEAPQNQHNRQPEERGRHESHDRIVSSRFRAGGDEDEHYRCNPVLFHQQPQEKKKKENHQAVQNKNEDVEEQVSHRGANPEKRIWAKGARIRRQLAEQREYKAVRIFVECKPHAVQSADQEIPPNQRVAELP